MSRLFIFAAVAVSVIFSSTELFAQQPESVREEFGKRAAMIPQTPADTGILFDEYRLEQAAQNYYNSARFSGTNEGKTMQQIEAESYDGMRKLQNSVSFKSQFSAAWQPIGGSQGAHVSGRVRGIAFDPTPGSKTVYIAAASGGIWKNPNIDARPTQWINLSDRLPTCNFGSIAVDPKRPNIIYAGTGESQGDNYREQISGTAPAGSGVFKSVDGGLNWDTVATTVLEGNVCSQIIIDPVNTDTVYIATGSNAFLKTYNGGTTWKKVALSVSALSLALDPVSSNKLYVSGFGSIYRSTDYGDTWTKCVTGLPGGGRITIAVAPSSPNIIYACIGNSSNQGTLGTWMSTDYGVNWHKTTLTTTTANPLGMQQAWCNSIVVHPTNPERIFEGGLDIYRSTDSGRTLSSISNWQSQPTTGSFVHADIHFLTFNGNALYACTDGGIARTTNFANWTTDMNEGIATLQFVGVDANKEFTYVTGGCQDNSTNRAWPGSTEFTETIGGDGGHAWISQEQGEIAYTTYVYANFKKSTDSAKTWSDNLLAGTGVAGENSPFYTVYDCNSDGSVIALGANSHVYVSTAGGTDGFPTKSNVSIGNSFAIHVAPFDPTGSIIWAASGGNIFRTFDYGNTWVKQTSGITGTITGITSNVNDPSQVFACATGGKHFFVSNDSGKTFTTPTGINLPNIPCWAIARHPVDGRLFLGTEKGVLWSNDGGGTWFPVMNGLPFAMVTQLRVRGTNNDKLLAGTYGRGMFWLDLTTLGVNDKNSVSLPLSLDPAFPNPMTTSQEGTIGFSLKNAGIATITLHDLLGREIRILEKSYFDAGRHQTSFNTNGLSSGTYFVMLTSNGTSISQKIVVE